MDGYTEAEKIEVKIKKLIIAYPVDKHNINDWLNFIRTIKTGVNLVEENLYEKLKKLEI